MATDTIRALQVDDTEITTRVVRSKALHQDCADGTGIEVSTSGADSGKLRLVDAGTSLGSGVQPNEMSKFAGATIKGSLAAQDTAAGLFSETNTYGSDLVVEVDILITTVTSGACTANIGVGSPAAVRDNLLDGIDLNGVTAPYVYTSIDSGDAGTNGKARYVWPSAGYLHGSVASGASAGLVGTYCIRVIDIN